MDRVMSPTESPDGLEQAYLVSIDQYSGVAKLGLNIDFLFPLSRPDLG